MVTLLTVEDVNSMKPLVERGKTAEASGYSYLTGVEAENKPQGPGKEWRLDGKRYYLLGDEKYSAHVMNDDGYTFGTGRGIEKEDKANDRKIGVRVVKEFKSLDELLKMGTIKEAEDGIIEIQYGEYPQTIVNEQLQEELEGLFTSGDLMATGETYTRDGRDPLYYDRDYYGEDNTSGRKYLKPKEPYKRIQDSVYLYEGKKYIRTIAKMPNDGVPMKGKTYKRDEMVWVEIEPITWLVDSDKKKMVTEKIMFGGIAPDDTGISLLEFINDTWENEIVQNTRKINPFTAAAKLAKTEGALAEVGNAEQVEAGILEAKTIKGETKDGK